MDAAALIARTTVLEEWVLDVKRQDKLKAASQSQGGGVAIVGGGGGDAALMPLLGAATGAAVVGATVASAAGAAGAASVPLDVDSATAGAQGAPLGTCHTPVSCAAGSQQTRHMLGGWRCGA